jgi:hypothetical protein
MRADKVGAVEIPATTRSAAAASTRQPRSMGVGGIRRGIGRYVGGVALGLSLGACALITPQDTAVPATSASGTDLARTLATIDSKTPANTDAAGKPGAAIAAAASAAVDTRPMPSDLRAVNSATDSSVATVAAGTAVDNEAAQNPNSPNYQTVRTPSPAVPATRIRTIDPETMRLALALATGPTVVPPRAATSAGNTAGDNGLDPNGWQLQAVVAVTRPDAGPTLARAETGWLRTQQVLPSTGCPAPNQLYLYADVSSGAGDSARRAADAMAPGCGVPVHRQTDLGRPDPIFDSVGSLTCKLDPASLRRDLRGTPAARQLQGKKTNDALVQYANADQGTLLRASPYLTARRATLAMRQVLGALTQQRFGVTVPWTHASTDSRVYWIAGDGAMFDAVTAMLDSTSAQRPPRRAGQPAQWLFSLWRNPADSHYYVRVNAVDPRTPAKSRNGRPSPSTVTLSRNDALRFSECDGADATGACALEDFQRTIGQRLAADCTQLSR